MSTRRVPSASTTIREDSDWYDQEITLADADGGYAGPDALLADLAVMRDAMASHGVPRDVVALMDEIKEKGLLTSGVELRPEVQFLC